MKKNNLIDINKKIYDLLISNGIKEEEMLSVIKNCKSNFENTFKITFTISEKYFNMLRDTIWFNLERNDNLQTLKDYGKKFPILMHLCDKENIIKNEDVISLINEMKHIKTIFEVNEIFVVNLTGTSELFDDTESKVCLCDKRKIKKIAKNKVDHNMITCFIFENIKSYHEQNIKINSLINGLMKCLNDASKKDVYIDINFTE